MPDFYIDLTYFCLTPVEVQEIIRWTPQICKVPATVSKPSGNWILYRNLSPRVTVLFAAAMVFFGLTAISTMTFTYPAKQLVIEGVMVGQSIFISAEIAAALHTTLLQGQVRMGGTGRLLIYV